MRSSLRRPRRCVSVATETLSIESRLTADRRGMGSSPVSSTTSLGSPRILVVQGATRARRSLGIAASRESTTTGRRAISGSSHHQTSPRAGKSITVKPQHHGRKRDHPTRRAHQVDARRRPHTQRRSLSISVERVERQELRRATTHHSSPNEAASHPRATPHQPLYSLVFVPCHHYAIDMLLPQSGLGVTSAVLLAG